MPRDVRPYLLPAPGVAILSPWELASTEGWEPLPDRLPDWDATVTHTIRRNVNVDFARLLDDTHLTSDVTLGWVVSWISSASKMRGAAPVVLIGPDGGSALLGTDLPGDRIDGTLTLRTTLTLIKPPAAPRPGAAHLPGSVLVDGFTEVGLGEPSAHGFPVQAVDFAATRLDPHASWHLETTTDLAAPFLGSFLLLLNTRDTELVEAAARDRRDRRQEALFDELEHGVAVVLLDLATHLRSELMEMEAWPAGSVGEALRRMLQRADRTGTLHVPIGSHNLARMRTRASGAARAIGHGRTFR